jgi:cobalamin biosynthesis Mg chelatase CobN
MVNEDILGGLVSALTRGESLKKAMMTFYNAGYKKEEIEEAARKLQQVTIQSPTEWRPQPIWASKQQKRTQTAQSRPSESGAPQASLQSQQASTQKSGQQPRKQVSSYEKKNTGSRTITILLVTLLLILVGLLATVIIFKEEVVRIFSNLFGG